MAYPPRQPSIRFTKPRRSVLLALVVGVCTPMIGCQTELPTEPSGLVTGIVIYQFADFLGESAHVTEDIADLDDVRGPCIKFDGDRFIDVWDDGSVATSGRRLQDGRSLTTTGPDPPSCPATIRSNGVSSNQDSSSCVFGGTCGMP